MVDGPDEALERQEQEEESGVREEECKELDYATWVKSLTHDRY